MGIGDEMMMAGEARRAAAGTARKYRILDRNGEHFWHSVFDGNPNIARPGHPYDGTLGFINGHRPYIEGETKERRTFREYTPTPAPLKLGPQALAFAKRAAGAVVFNPSIKRKASPNKDWGWARWRDLVQISRTEIRWIQLGEAGVPAVRGAEFIHTPGFHDAVGLLSGARAAVLHEGALHHAAAAVGTPAVVIYGGYIGPRVTGYPGQKALFMDTPEWPLGCGMRVPCEHCKTAMESFTPSRVLAALRELLAGKC